MDLTFGLSGGLPGKSGRDHFDVDPPSRAKMGGLGLSDDAKRSSKKNL